MSNKNTDINHFTDNTAEYQYKLLRTIRHILEAGLALIFVHLPMRFFGQYYSILLAKIIGFIGPLLPHNKRIMDNLDIALPELKQDTRKQLEKKIWQNLAFIPFDFINAKYNPALLKNEIIGLSELDKIKAVNKPIIFFSAHCASWEIIRTELYKYDVNTAIIYRAFNNPFIDSYTRKLMDHGFAPIFQKTSIGIRKMIQHLRGGNHILILTDQKLRKGGIKIPFFDKDAWTAPSIAELAIKYNFQLVPIFITREKLGHNKIIIHPSLSIYDTLENKEDRVKNILTDMNNVIENHIRQYPHEWFWHHKRWQE